jgi:diguanylate cyclase (GGDEF)-like protein
VNHPSTAARLSLALVCLTVSILVLAVAAGLVPDRAGAVLDGRKALCEQMAVACSLSAQRGDLDAVQALATAAVQRQRDLRSAGVRRADGKLLVEVGDHEAHWPNDLGGHSTPTHVHVPVVVDSKLWGNVELRFRPVGPAGALAPFGGLALPLLAFVGVAGFVAYFAYLRLIFRRSGLVQADVIPRRVRTTLNTLAEGVVILDKEERIALANEAFAQLVDRPAADLQGRRLAELDWADPHLDGEAGDCPWARALGEGATQTGAILGLHTDDSRYRTVSVNSAPILADDGAPRGALATFDNLTTLEKKNSHLRKVLQKLKHSRAEIRRQNQELKALATRDPLTGCLNRRAFFPEFETQWNLAQRYGQPVSCVMVDIDHFKAINDTHGHGVGDQVLQQLAEAVRSMMRKTDLICRYGGEEFCVLLPHVDIAEAYEAAERFRQGIGARTFAGLAVTASLGVSAYGLGAREPRAMLEQADKALYAAKRRGRNRVVRWDAIAGTDEADKPEKPGPPPPDDPAARSSIPFHAVTALLSALAYRHPDTAEHSRRVADLCVAAANGLLSQSECYVLEVAGLLHDIGKLGVPDAVLLKPGPLTEAEWKVIRTHEHVGEEIIAAAFTDAELSAIIRSHHCWYGGSPHDPDLPKGQDIPLGARILAIADAYDAMVSDRVYRRGRPREAAFAELRRCAEVQFDPELVEHFIDTVLARDESRTPPALRVSKQTALKIGIQMEKLASALDANDTGSLALMAAHLSATAGACGIAPIAEVAATLEQAAARPTDRVRITQLTVDLLDLCRATYGSYLPEGHFPTS